MHKFSLYLPDGKRKPFSLISPTKNITPDEFYQSVKVGEIQMDLIQEIRRLSITKELALENKSEISANKEYLAGARMSGIFAGGIADSNMIDYSYRLVVDIDKEFEDLESLKSKLSFDSYTEACFKSVSGQGLAVVIKIDLKDKQPSKEIHRDLFYGIEAYFWKKYQKVIDPSCKNLSRFRYVSFDPDIYVNLNSATWSETRPDSIHKPKPAPASTTPKPAPATQQPDQYQESDESLVLSRAVNFILNARDGQLHAARRDAAYTVGGYVGSGIVSEQLAIDTLMDAVIQRGTTTPDKALDTIKSGIDSGKMRPIHEVKRQRPTNQPKTYPKPEVKSDQWWSETYNDKGKFTGYEYEMSAYTNWLTTTYSIYRYTTPSNERQIVQSNDGILTILTRETLHDILKPYFAEHPETLHTDIVLNSTKKREFLDVNYGLTGLLEITETGRTFDFKHPEIEFLCYQNCIVKIGKTTISTIQYKDFDGLIWEDQVIKRPYDPDHTKGEYETFVGHLAGQELPAFKSAIGYMLHSHKSPSKAKAVIVHDTNLTDKANGGTGKSILCDSLKYFKHLTPSDGKKVSTKDSFLFENVSEQTQILFIDDLRRGFSIEIIYNKITGSFQINRKGAQLVTLDFERSPKIIATTNFTIKKTGTSDDRRLFSLEVTNFFNSKTNKVSDYFGHDLFTDWVGDLYHEWNRMDYFITQCISFYLAHGLIEQKFSVLAEKEFLTECGEEFIDFMDSFSYDGVLRISTYTEKDQTRHTKKSIRKSFIDYLFENKLNDRYYREMTSTTMWDRVVRWAAFRKFEITENVSNGQVYHLFTNSELMQINKTNIPYTPEQLTEGWLDN